MLKKKEINSRIARAAWGALLVWWGVALIVEPITLGMGAIGTGLIFLGTNAVRAIYGIPRYTNNYFIGGIAIAWGILDQVIMMLAMPALASFALLLVLFGIAQWITTLLPQVETES